MNHLSISATFIWKKLSKIELASNFWFLIFWNVKKIELAQKRDLIQINGCHFWIQRGQIVLNQLKNLKQLSKKVFVDQYYTMMMKMMTTMKMIMMMIMLLLLMMMMIIITMTLWWLWINFVCVV